MEIITLTTPVSGFIVRNVNLVWRGPNSYIYIVVEGAGSIITHEYSGVEAETTLKGLNTANLSAKSLHKRVLEKLVLDGILTGTISGVPD